MMLMRLSRMLVVIAALNAASCMELQRRLHYENLDAVTVDATGKRLWEIQVGDAEILKIKTKLWNTEMSSLYCIRDNANSHFTTPTGLSDAQIKLRGKNLKLLVSKALLPVIEMRESAAKRQIVLQSCNTQ